MNVAELLAIPASMFPEQEILRFEGQAFSYASLVELAGGFASRLSERGVRRCDVVAALDTNCPALVAALFGATALGASFAPLNYRARGAELGRMVELLQPKLLLAGERYLDAAPRAPHWERLEALPERQAPAAAAPTPRPRVWLPARDSSAALQREGTFPRELVPADVDDAASAVLLFTSGTSADPKAVILPHGSLTNAVFETTDGADGSDRGGVLLAAPLYHVAGLSALLNAIFGGRRIVLMRQFEAGEWLRLAAAERVTHAFLVPTMLKQVLEHPTFGRTDLSSLQVLSYGAAPMPLSLIRTAIERLPSSVQFLNAFGQTETTSTVTVLGPQDHRLEGTPEEVETKLRRLRSIGKPVPGVEIHILDEAGRDLPPASIGEIAVASDRLMSGYLGQPGDGQCGLLRTRDLGWMDEDGYVYLAGRASDLIIRGGENIAPDEIEAVLEAHPSIAEAAVIGLPDEDWGERVAAVVALSSGASVSAAELIDFCRQRLAGYKKPEIILFVDALPRNALGKVLRKELRARYASPTGVA